MRTIVHQMGGSRHPSLHLDLCNDGAEYVQSVCIEFHVNFEVLYLILFDVQMSSFMGSLLNLILHEKNRCRRGDTYCKRERSSASTAQAAHTRREVRSTQYCAELEH